jgi:hypothetical protein
MEKEKEILEKIKEMAKENPNDYSFGGIVGALLIEEKEIYVKK